MQWVFDARFMVSLLLLLVISGAPESPTWHLNIRKHYLSVAEFHGKCVPLGSLRH